MTNTNTAATMSTADQLRAALKAAGYNARRVTVKHDHYSMGSSLYVTIRDASVPKSAIETIANSFEIVRRDESGEILGGGNRFLHVDYARGVLEAQTIAIAEVLAAAKPNTTIEVAGRRVSKMAPSAGRWDWNVVSFDEVEPRIHCHVNGGEKADELMFAARLLAEGAVELAAAVVAPAHNVEQKIPTIADAVAAIPADATEQPAPVLAPSNCLPLAPFPAKRAHLSIVRDTAPAPVATVTEDWAAGF